MKEFKTAEKKQFKIIIEDKEFIMEAPKVRHSMELNKLLKGLDQTSFEATEVMINWLDSLGLPRSAVDNMYPSDLKTLIEDYLSDNKKK